MQKINLSDEGVVREKILNGGIKMAEMVSLTLGPNGRSIVIDNGTNDPLVLDDGRRAAENVKLDDPIEHMGGRILYQLTRRTDEKVGDGTTTSVVLAHALLTEIARERIVTGGMVGNYAQIPEVLAEIEEGKNIALEEIDKLSKEVKTEKDLINVATVSAKDPKLGEIIGRMFFQLGKDGHVAHEFNLLSDEIESEVVPGYRFNGTYADKFMWTDAERRESVLTDVHVLSAYRKDIEVNEVKGLCAEVQNSGKTAMVIIARKFTVDFLKSVYATAVKGKFNILCVRAPSLHEDQFEDIAIFTGGKYFGEKDDLKTATKADLGYVERIDAKEDETVIIGGRGNDVLIKKRIKEIKADLAAQKAYPLRKIREDRISAMAGGVGVIRIGAATEERRNYLKEKVQDTKYATKAAFQGGIVPGGGQAYKKAAEKLPEGHILRKALLAPYEKLKEMAGGKLTIGKDVVDPTLVEKTALINACSAVSSLITIGGAIAIKRKPDLELALKSALGKVADGVEEDEDVGED